MANISQVKLPNNSIYDIVPVVNPNNTVIDASVYVGPYPLDANSLCMVATDGRLYPFVQTLGTNTNSTYSNIPADIKFRIGTDVFAAGKAYDGSAGVIDVSTLATSKEVDIRYSSRRLTGASGTSYSAIPAGQHNEIYMYISVQSEEGTFSLASNYMEGFSNPNTDWHVNILAKEKVKANTFCMFLGYSSSYSTYYKVWLSPEHPIYYCDSERNFIPYDTWKNNIQDTSIASLFEYNDIQDVSIALALAGNGDASLYINKALDADISVGAYPLAADSVCMIDTSGNLVGLKTVATVANTTASNITPNTVRFPLETAVYVAGKAYSAGASATDASLYLSKTVDIRYSLRYYNSGTTNASSNSTYSETYTDVYIPITINDDNGTFSISNNTAVGTYYANVIVRSRLAANRYYLYLGHLQKQGDPTKVWVDINHPIYWYDGTNLIPYDTWRNNIQDTSISLIDTSISLIDSSITNINNSITTLDANLCINRIIDGSIQIDEYPLYEDSLCAFTIDNKLCAFIQSVSPGSLPSNNPLVPNTKIFRLGCDILIAGSHFAANDTSTSVNCIKLSDRVNGIYCMTNWSNGTNASGQGYHKRLYMPIDINANNGTFTLKTITVSNTAYNFFDDYHLPANNFYMFMGYTAVATGRGFIFMLDINHPIYWYDGTNLIPYDTWRNNNQDTSINIIDGSITNIENTINNLPASDASLYINKIVDGSIKIDAYPLNKDSLCAFTTSNLLCAFVQDATTGTASIVPNSKKFRLGCDILIAGSDYTAGQSASKVYTLKVSDKIDLRYSETTHTAGTNSSNNTHREMFMPIDISTLSGTFTLKTVTKSSKPYNFIQKASLVSNNFYMYMGYIAENATSYSFWLDTNHPIYWYDGTNLIPYDTWRNNIQDTSISLIDTSITNIESAISSGSIYFAKTASGSGNMAMLVSIPEVTAYYEGLKIVLYYTLDTASSVSATLQVNNLAAKRIYAKGTTALLEGLAVNSINYLCYVGTASDGYFILDRDTDKNDNTLAYKNPVAGYNTNANDAALGERRFVANTLIKAQLVFEGTDNSIYSITQSDVSVNPDWGLAYWNGGGRVGVSTLSVNDVIQQESILIADTCIGIDTTGLMAKQYFPVYAWFKYTNNTIKSTVDSSVLHPTIPLATNLSNDTYVYVGTVESVNNHAKYLHMDLSNHDFITLGNRSASANSRTITAINGKILDGGSTSGGSYNNPVSGAGSNPRAAVDIDSCDLVCLDFNQNGLVPLKKYIAGEILSSGIVYDWGLAFCVEDVSQGQAPSEGSLLQQITFTTSSSVQKPLPIYAFFDSDGMPLEGEGNAPVIDGISPGKVSPYAPLAPNNKQLTTIYIGWWEGNSFHVDLSNHDFITYYVPVPEGVSPVVTAGIDNDYSISHINGRPLARSGGGVSLDGQGYGVCNSHTGGGEPQEEYATGGEDSGDSGTISTPKSGDSSLGDSSSGDSSSGGETPRSGEWTGIVTLSGYDAIANSVVSVYFPSGQTPIRNSLLNINSQGAYPIMLKGNNIRNGDIEADSIVIFMFDGTAYNVIAGYKQGDYELTTRKVQSISASSTSSQYPSARCIYNIIGNIEAALQAI